MPEPQDETRSDSASPGQGEPTVPMRILDEIADGLVILDREWRYTHVSAPAARILGRPRSELLGRRVWDLLPLILGAEVERQLRRAADEQVACEFPSHDAATERFYENRAFPTPDGGVAVYTRDITERTRQERLVGTARAYAESIVATVREPLLVLDKDLRVVSANRSFYANFVVRPAETEGRFVYDLGDGQWDIPRLRTFLEEIVPTNGWFDEFEVVHDFEHIGRKAMLLNARRFPPDGPFELILLAIEDITERKQAEEVRALLAAIVEGSDDAVISTTVEGIIRSWNVGAERLFGYAAAEAVGRSIDLIVPPELQAEERSTLERLRRGERVEHFETARVSKQSRRIPISLTISPLRDHAGRVVGASKVGRDITDRKRLEEELRRAKEAAEAASRAKDEFLANVSHEIRTPFGAILGMTELVLDSSLTDDQRQCLETARSAAESLLGLVEGLLDFEKIEAGKLDLVPVAFSLRATLGDLVRIMAVRAEGKGLELTCDVQPVVPDALAGDAARLRQVLLNLIGNAIKFTGRGRVAASVGVADGRAPEGEVDLRFAVSDTGIGIPADGRERIFRAFEQLDSSTARRYGGTGLGLTIAARLVALMGGTIEVESEPGRGSTFAFTARFGRPPPSEEGGVARPSDAAPEAAASAPAVAPLRILVAEDSEFNSRHLERLLGRRGHAVRVATDGREALDLVDEAAFDLVILDVHMPVLDGFQVARAVRDRERATGGHLPVIALTGRARPEDRERCLAAGMDDYLAKPVRSAELFAAIDRVISALGGPRPGS